MTEQKIYKGDLGKLIGSLILYSIMTSIFVFFPLSILDEFSNITVEFYSLPLFFLGITAEILLIIRAFKDYSTKLVFSENQATINKDSYSYNEFVIQPEIRRVRYNGIPIRNKLRLHLYNKNGEAIKSYRFEGFKASTANLIFNELENRTSSPAVSTNPVYNDEIQNTRIIYSKEKNFTTNLKGSNKRFAVMSWVFTVLLISPVFFMSNFDDAFSFLILGFLFFIAALFFTFKDTSKKYPKNISFTKDEIIINDKHLPKSEINRIFFTPPHISGVFRLLQIQTTKQSYNINLGISRCDDKVTNEVFSDYEEFTEYLRTNFEDTPEKVIEDVTLSRTHRI